MGKRFFIVDDDAEHVLAVEKAILKIGGQCKKSENSSNALEQILQYKPHVVIVDYILPHTDGLELCHQIRANEHLKEVKIIILSAKAYATDLKRAYRQGADAYLLKPFCEKAFTDLVESFDHMELAFWGVRGTLPLPGEASVKYGGNTSCVTLHFSNNRVFIFDAGTGIREYARDAMKNGATDRRYNILITHPHWDHINAFPFFTPLYIAGNNIKVYGPSQHEKNMHEIMSDQMDGMYFPVTFKQFGSSVAFHDLAEGEYHIQGIGVETKLLNHPGNCLGYKVSHGGKTVCYITDNEIFRPDHPQFTGDFRNSLLAFLKGVDILIHDVTYFDEDYPAKVNWGHTCVDEAVKLAHEAQVKNFYLFHHDPDQLDTDIDRKLKICKAKLKALNSKTRCFAPKEGDRVRL